MNKVKCLVCDSNSSYLFNQNYLNKMSSVSFKCNFYKCNNCGTAFIYPQPDSDTISSSYSSDYDCYIEKSGNETIKYSSLKLKLAMWRFPKKTNISSLIKKGTSILLEILIGKKITYTLGVPLNLNSDAKILEVGYGTGYWLKMMNELNFLNLYGFDIQNNASYSEELIKLGIVVKNNISLDKINWNDTFDLIRLEHVFEHITDPKSLSSLLYNLLSDKGILVMTLPSIDSIVKRNKWLENSYDLDIPRHLFHYSKKSIRIILEKHGFSNIKVTNIPVFYNFLRNIFIRFKINENRLNSLFFKGFVILFSPVYYLICFALNKGEFLSVRAEK